MTSPLLVAEGLSKTYRTGDTLVPALRDFSCTVRAGESLGIVGESGSGKSTAARILVGLEKADAGRVLVDGRPFDTPGRGRAARLARARAVQIVFQDPYLSLDPRIPVGAAIEAVVELHTDLSATDRRARVTELLDQVGLGRREADARPRQLSGGQRQRVAIARALAASPRVIVLDEAVSALDVSVQAQVLRLLDRIREGGDLGLVFVSHDLAVVRHACDRTVVLRRGHIVEESPTAQLLDHPQHPYTQLLRTAVPRPGWNPDEIADLRRQLTEA